MFDVKGTLTEYGLTSERYEEFLKDCTDKVNRVSDLDWSEINAKYGISFNSDTTRKGCQPPLVGGVFVKEYLENKYSNSTLFNDDEYLKELKKQKQEIQKERQKLFDERTALKKELREQARRESMFEIVKRAIDEYEPVKFEYIPNCVGDSNNDLIIHVTDLHAGMEIDSIFNKFNTDILQVRLKRFLDEIIDIRNTYNSENAYVILGGDMIHGLIHTNSRIESKENVVMQIMTVSDLISNFVYELSKVFKYVEVHTTAGNHSRSMANKEEAIKGENFDLLIPYACKKDLKYVSNVLFADNYLDCDIAAFKVRGHMVYAAHGDKDSSSTIVNNMIKFARKINIDLPDICYLGHRHTNGLTTVDDVKVIESGCIDGMDSFAIDKRLVGTPEQTVTVVTKNRKIKALCDIQLD